MMIVLYFIRYRSSVFAWQLIKALLSKYFSVILCFLTDGFFFFFLFFPLCTSNKRIRAETIITTFTWHELILTPKQKINPITARRERRQRKHTRSHVNLRKLFTSPFTFKALNRSEKWFKKKLRLKKRFVTDSNKPLWKIKLLNLL